MQTAPREPGSRNPVVNRIINAFNPDVDRSWKGLPSQAVLIGIAAIFYFGVRMFMKGSEADAYANAQDLLHFEESLGLAWEFTAQQWVLGNKAIVTFFNWVYIWLHWPVIVGSLLWLYRHNRDRYVVFRNALFVSGAIGLLFFMSFPLAPPRFLEGFTDTVTNLSTSYRYLQPPSIVNKYAAMPSLHVGWNLLAGIVLYQALRQNALRFLPIISPILMVLAVVFTANHYVVDAIMGIAVAAVGLAGANLIGRWAPPAQPVIDTPEDDDEEAPVALLL